MRRSSIGESMRSSSSLVRRQSDASGREDPTRHFDGGFPMRRSLRRSSQSYENLRVRMKSGSMKSSASFDDLGALEAEEPPKSHRESSSVPVSRNSSRTSLVPKKSEDGGKPTLHPDLATLVIYFQKKQGFGQQVGTCIYAACSLR